MSVPAFLDNVLAHHLETYSEAVSYTHLDVYKRQGITCTTCMNVRDVVTAIRQSDYDMILTDVQMPDIDGFELGRAHV